MVAKRRECRFIDAKHARARPRRISVLLTGGNRNDVTPLQPLLQAVPPIRPLVFLEPRCQGRPGWAKKMPS